MILPPLKTVKKPFPQQLTTERQCKPNSSQEGLLGLFTGRRCDAFSLGPYALSRPGVSRHCHTQPDPTGRLCTLLIDRQIEYGFLLGVNFAFCCTISLLYVSGEKIVIVWISVLCYSL